MYDYLVILKNQTVLLKLYMKKMRVVSLSKFVVRQCMEVGLFLFEFDMDLYIWVVLNDSCSFHMTCIVKRNNAWWRFRQFCLLLEASCGADVSTVDYTTFKVHRHAIILLLVHQSTIGTCYFIIKGDVAPRHRAFYSLLEKYILTKYFNRRDFRKKNL